MFLTLLLVLPFIGSAVAALLPSTAKKLEAWLAGTITVVCALLVLSQTTVIVPASQRSEEHTSELQSRGPPVCRLLRERNYSFAVRRSSRGIGGGRPRPPN